MQSQLQQDVDKIPNGRAEKKPCIKIFFLAAIWYTHTYHMYIICRYFFHLVSQMQWLQFYKGWNIIILTTCTYSFILFSIIYL